MFIRALARALALAAVAVSVAACEYSPSTVDRTLAYNNAISQSTNDLFLLNAVRASQREPTYYTRNQADTTTSSMTPTLSGTTPLGSTQSIATAAGSNLNPIGIPSGFLNTATVTKTLTQAARSLTTSLTGTESNQLTLTNLDDQLSTNGLLTPVTLQQFSNYTTLGYPSLALYLLYFQNISMSKRIVDNLPNAITENCALESNKANIYCQYFFRYPSGFADAGKFVSETGSNHDGWRFTAFVPGHFNPVCFDNNGTNDTTPPFDAAAREVQRAREGLAHSKEHSEEFKKATENLDPLASQSVRIERQDTGLEPAISADDLKTITYSNDPAVDGPLFDDAGNALTAPPTIVYDKFHHAVVASSKPAMHYFGCFKEVLTALLALDLGPSPSGTSKILYRLPAALANKNPRYFADLTQQSFDLAISTDKSEVGVCKKPDAPVMNYSSDDYVNGIFGFDPALLRAAAMHKALDVSASTDTAPSGVAGVESQGGASGAMAIGPLPSKSPTAVVVTFPALHSSSSAKQDCANALKQAEDGDREQALTKNGNPAVHLSSAKQDLIARATKTPSVDKTPTINYTPRSLEDMVYFLGQIVRRRHQPSISALGPVTFWNAADPDHPYEEELFDVHTGSPSSGSIAVADAGDSSYYIPKLCPTEEAERTTQLEGCTPEYPNHASALILDMLNQLWGLNKTQATAPIVAPVTVINPG